MENEQKGQPELSRPLKIDGIPRAGIEERIIAKPVEREALAKRLKVLGLKRFEATINVEHEKGHMFSVSGGIYAELTQKCVVTLEPVEETVRTSFDIVMAPDYVLAKLRKKKDHEIPEAEEAEPIEGNVLDLGELAVQFLAMDINPYPRKEGAAWEVISVGESDAEKEKSRTNPFLKLAETIR